MSKWTVFQFKCWIVILVILYFFYLMIGLWHWLRLIEHLPFVWLRHSRHLPLGYCIVSLYWFIKNKGQLVELHKLWGQFQANLNLGWCLSLCNPCLISWMFQVTDIDWTDWCFFLKLHLVCWSSTWFVTSFDLIESYYCILLFCIICETWLLQM